MCPRSLPLRSLSLGLLLGLLACGDKGEPDGGGEGAEATDTADTGGEGDGAGPVDCGDPTGLSWDAFGAGFFRTYCTACHSSTTPDRHGAPPGVDLDTEEAVRALGPRVRARTLDAQTMPVGGGVLEEDRVLLDRYLCLNGA